MADVVGHHLGDLLVGAGVADAPAGHGVCLGHAVDEDGALLGIGAEGGEAGELPSVIGQAGVDLVGDDVEVGLLAHGGQGLQLLLAVHHAGGVGGVVEHDGLGLGGDGPLQLAGGELEVLGLGGGDHHGHAAHHLDELIVADPVGRGQDHLVAGVDQGPQSQVHQVLGTAAHHHLAGLVLQAVVRLHAAAYRLAQLHRAGGGGVAGHVLLDGGNARRLDLVGGIEVGLTGAEADDVDAVSLHLLEHGVNGHGGGSANLRGDPGQLFQWNLSLVLSNSALLYASTCKIASPYPKILANYE